MGKQMEVVVRLLFCFTSGSCKYDEIIGENCIFAIFFDSIMWAELHSAGVL